MLTTMKLWIWLSLSCAPKAAWQAWKHFGSVERLYAADREELSAVPGLRREQIEALCRKSTERAERILGRCDELGMYLFCYEDEEYPQRLRELYLPPMVLYCWGQKFSLENECVIAMAGTRRCSAYGRAMADHFAFDLTRQGALVLTGMASGCDETALLGAMRSGGPVAALLPGGVDVPFENSAYYRNFYRAVREQGVLISPYPPGTRNDHKHFFYRNPILTGLSVATLCVESGVRSGVLNVASHANEQQRPLYVVPANLDSASAAGTNALLCEGIAMPVMSAADILLPFQASYPQLHLRTGTGSILRSKAERKGDSKGETRDTEGEKKVDTGAPDQYIDLQTDATSLTAEERSLLNALAEGEKTAEELSAQCQLSGAQTLSTLTLLTLRGAVEELGGGRFRALVRIKEEQQE